MDQEGQPATPFAAQAGATWPAAAKRAQPVNAASDTATVADQHGPAATPRQQQRAALQQDLKRVIRAAGDGSYPSRRVPPLGVATLTGLTFKAAKDTATQIAKSTVGSLGNRAAAAREYLGHLLETVEHPQRVAAETAGHIGGRQYSVPHSPPIMHRHYWQSQRSAPLPRSNIGGIGSSTGGAIGAARSAPARGRGAHLGVPGSSGGGGGGSSGAGGGDGDRPQRRLETLDASTRVAVDRALHTVENLQHAFEERADEMRESVDRLLDTVEHPDRAAAETAGHIGGRGSAPHLRPTIRRHYWERVAGQQQPDAGPSGGAAGDSGFPAGPSSRGAAGGAGPGGVLSSSAASAVEALQQYTHEQEEAMRAAAVAAQRAIESMEGAMEERAEEMRESIERIVETVTHPDRAASRMAGHIGGRDQAEHSHAHPHSHSHSHTNDPRTPQ